MHRAMASELDNLDFEWFTKKRTSILPYLCKSIQTVFPTLKLTDHDKLVTP